MPFYWGYKSDSIPASGLRPMFLYLHGSGPKDHEWSTGLKLATRFDDAPSIYFIPQIPNEGEYYRWWQKSKQYAWNRLLRQALASGQVDPDRIYMFGISEGGIRQPASGIVLCRLSGRRRPDGRWRTA